MRKLFFSVLAKVFRVNFDSTPADVIVDQMLEPRPLPLGRTEFGEWSYRIITGAMLPNVKDEDPIAFLEGQKFALANMIMHLGPTESHKPDAFFIHQLRKVVANQVAHTLMQEIKELSNARQAKADDAKASAAPKLECVN